MQKPTHPKIFIETLNEFLSRSNLTLVIFMFFFYVLNY